MNTDLFNNFLKNKRSIRVFLLITIIGVFLSSNLYAKTAKEIDASVDAAIERFYKQVKGAKEFEKASKGMLVMPNVVKGAFIIGGEYGEGALRVGGKTVDYYNTISGSIGFQIGGQSKDIILLFMTERLNNLEQATAGKLV
jgi:lipid-binding SYLF domain-containing protein